MKKPLLVAIVYIIVFALEILIYYISKEGLIFIYGLITLFAFMFTFASVLSRDD